MERLPQQKLPLAPKPSALSPRKRNARSSSVDDDKSSILTASATGGDSILCEIEEVFRDIKVPRALRKTIVNNITKMEKMNAKQSNPKDAVSVPASTPRYRSYVGDNASRFRRAKVLMRQPKGFVGLPESITKAQCRAMREHEASIRQRAAMQVCLL